MDEQPNQQFSGSPYETPSHKKQWIIVAILTLVVIVVTIFVVRFIASKRTSQIPVPDVVGDMDRDGIPDEEERALGTSLEEFDTDGDGIADDIEISIHGTDPTDEDTDDDGFSDGFEIIQGSNPLGEGNL